MFSKAACIILTFPFLLNCATWQSGMRKSFRGVSVGAEQAAIQATETCKTIQQLCIAKKTNPCPALTKCLAIRAYIIQVAVTAQLVALAGYTAVDLADKPKATEALKEALRLLAATRKALGVLK